MNNNSIFSYPNWSTIHHKHWSLLFTKHINDTSPLTMVEVGCFEGRSSLWFAKYLSANPHSRLICIDNWQGGEEIERTKQSFDMDIVRHNFFNNIKNTTNSLQICSYVMDSERGLSSLMGSHYRGVDFIYLDGSHTQRDTLVDLTLALSLLKRGGIIIVDDYNNSMATNNKFLRPKDAVDFVVKSFDNEIGFSTTPEQQAVIIRK